MIKLLPAAAGALITALMLTACTSPAHHASGPSAAQCARAEEEVRDAALLVGPLSGVTTSRDLAAAIRRMGPAGRVVRGFVSRSKSGPTVYFSASGQAVMSTPLPPPLARETQRVVGADWNAFWRAVRAYNRVRAGPQAIGEAAQTTMRDIQAVRATCARKPR